MPCPRGSAASFVACLFLSSSILVIINLLNGLSFHSGFILDNFNLINSCNYFFFNLPLLSLRSLYGAFWEHRSVVWVQIIQLSVGINSSRFSQVRWKKNKQKAPDPQVLGLSHCVIINVWTHLWDKPEQPHPPQKQWQWLLKQNIFSYRLKSSSVTS